MPVYRLICFQFSDSVRFFRFCVLLPFERSLITNLPVRVMHLRPNSVGALILNIYKVHILVAERRSTCLNVDANNNIMVIYQWFLGENFSLKKSSYRAARIRRSYKFSSYLHTNRKDIVNKLGNTKIRFKFVSVSHCYQWPQADQVYVQRNLRWKKI